jgi:predicted ATPase/DNA-binding CsgD family transcriptional regulator/tetratricopeptide (TPR) repeat protein
MQTREALRLPEELSSFVGRTSEVAELRELLQAVRAVTLCGAGGIGKTRLALRLLSAVAQEYPDGTWFVELAEVRRPQDVPVKVAAALGIDEEPRRQLADTVADALRPRQALIVLDNCEHLIGACASLCQRLLASAPGLKVIVTSREPMRVAAEAVWHVPPLALPPAGSSAADEVLRYDSVQLFAMRAAAAAPGFTVTAGNAAAVAAVCRALDGLPLAIELAAAWARALSVGQIRARLDHRLTLLTSGERAVPARHRALRATFDWSYELLSAPEQVLLRRLSVFGDWSLEMSEQVCADDGLPAAEILDLITALADKSLLELDSVTLGQARYRMLESVREYAHEWLTIAGEAPELYRRRLEYVVHEAESGLAVAMAAVPAPWSARVELFKRMDLEAGNLREVLASCLADGDAEHGLRICAAMRPVWIVRGSFADGAAWMDAFLGMDGFAAVPVTVRGAALIGRAQLALASGSDGAEDLALTGLELSAAAGEQTWQATALNLLAEAALHAGQPEKAAARAAEALRAARSAGDRWNESYAFGTMAALAGQRGALREAQDLGEQALAITRDVDQLWGAARAMLGLGDLARMRGEHDAARQYYIDALAILRELNARPDIARCLAGLGRIAIDQADLPAARQHLADSLRLSYASGSRIGMARGLEALARLALLEGNPETALRLAGAVAALRAEAHLPPVPGARVQRYLDGAAELGQYTVAALWGDGLRMTSAAAVRLALHEEPAEAGRGGPLDTGPPAGRGADATAAAPAPGAPASALTPRERQVVALLGDGLSNRAIAAELYISPATAARHVANILIKLGFTSRSQVAAWAAGTSQGPPNSALTDSPP